MLSIFRQMAGQKFESISAEVAKSLLNRTDTVFIDVREPYEFQSGHIPKAKNIPVGQIASRFGEIDPKKEVVVVCASGMRSQRAAQVLMSEGYGVKNMTGGMSAWRGPVK